MPPQTPAADDEDAAEARRAPDEHFSVIHAEAPQLAAAPTQAQSPAIASPALAAVPAVPPAPAKTQAPAIRPTARPEFVAAPTVVAMATPDPRPQQPNDAKLALFQPAPKPATALNRAVPTLRPEVGEGDEDQPGMTVPGHNWTIQIGAYADQALAKAELASYAQKAQDVLGQAARIVAPITRADGHTLYRARFGLYAEREARQVCDRLTQRGQTCFAAVAR
jgi:D-alanyl-D-alanine carboxypeptidase